MKNIQKLHIERKQIGNKSRVLRGSYYGRQKNCKGYYLSSDEYYGRWILCDGCGYDYNTIKADYCGGCGRKIEIVGKAKYDWEKDKYIKVDYVEEF